MRYDFIRRMLGWCVLNVVVTPCVQAWQPDFEVEGVYYQIESDEVGKRLVTVVPLNNEYQFPLENGCLEIPSSVTYRGKTYSVSSLSSMENQIEMVRLILPDELDYVVTLRNMPRLEYVDFGGIHTLCRFENAPALKTMLFGSQPKIWLYRFNLTNIGLEEWKMPESIIIEDKTLQKWPNLRSLDMSALAEINMEICTDLPALETLWMPERLLNYTSGLDSYCNLPSLKRVTLPREVNKEFQLTDCFIEVDNLREIYCPSETPILVNHLLNRDQLSWLLSPAAVESFLKNTKPMEWSEPKPEFEYANIGFDGIDKENCVVYVPEGCVDVYRAHPSWSVFRNIVEYDFASQRVIQRDDEGPLVTVDGDGITVAGEEDFTVYDLAGQQCPSRGLSPGVYIVRTSSGTTSKVRIR